jgi:hypothetical protein
MLSRVKRRLRCQLPVQRRLGLGGMQWHGNLHYRVQVAGATVRAGQTALAES